MSRVGDGISWAEQHMSRAGDGMSGAEQPPSPYSLGIYAAHFMSAVLLNHPISRYFRAQMDP